MKKEGTGGFHTDTGPLNKEDRTILILFVLVFGFAMFVTFVLIYLDKSEGFELTAEQKQDEALTQVCMLYHIDNKECFMVYGSIDNPYEP